MAYQQVSIPRFYVDLGLFNQAVEHSSPWLDEGIADKLDVMNLYGLNPSRQNTWTEYWGFSTYIQKTGPVRYVAILGHKMASDPIAPGNGVWGFSDYDGTSVPNLGVESVVNGGIYGSVVDYDGFTIAIFEDDPDATIASCTMAVGITNVSVPVGTVGAVSIGNYYEMKNAANLSLTQSIEYDSIKEITTYNGSSLSNSLFRQHTWGDLGAWELVDPEGVITPPSPSLSRSGRRTWDLKFSYMDDGDLWGPNQMLSTYMEPGTTGVDTGDKDMYNVSPTIAANGDLETETAGGLGDTLYTEWNKYEPYAPSLTLATFEVSTEQNNTPGGSNSLKVRATRVTEGCTTPFTILTEGVQYKMSCYIYRESNAATLKIFPYYGGANVFSELTVGPYGVWEKIEAVFTATAVQCDPTQGEGFIIYNNTGASDTTFYVDDYKLEPTNPSIFQSNLLNDDNFFSQVWSKTLGPTLPFIFQPNKDNANPDGFAIARFKENSLKATQTAHNVYDISLKIEEVF